MIYLALIMFISINSKWLVSGSSWCTKNIISNYFYYGYVVIEHIIRKQVWQCLCLWFCLIFKRLKLTSFKNYFQVDTIRPSLFLEAAFVSNDSQHLAAVLRFFTDFLPGFKNTSDHNRYCRILNEMNSSLTVWEVKE